MAALTGTSCFEQEELLGCFLRWQVPEAPEKRITRQPKVESRGAEMDGYSGLAFPQLPKILVLMVLTAFILN